MFNIPEEEIEFISLEFGSKINLGTCYIRFVKKENNYITYAIVNRHDNQNLLELRSTEKAYDNFLYVKVNDIKKKKTNNRSEYLAYIVGKHLCNHLFPNEELILISDSNLLIKTLEIWLKGWIKKNIVHTKANVDLLNLMITFGTYPSKCHHINSHLTPTQKKALDKENFYYSTLNDMADDLANLAIL